MAAHEVEDVFADLVTEANAARERLIKEKRWGKVVLELYIEGGGKEHGAVIVRRTSGPGQYDPMPIDAS